MFVSVIIAAGGRGQRFGGAVPKQMLSVGGQSVLELPAEYRAEPALALDGGDDGMDFIRPLLHGLPAHLAPGGLLLLEIGHERAHFEAAFPHLQPVWLDTSAGDDAVLLLTAEDLQT